METLLLLYCSVVLTGLFWKSLSLEKKIRIITPRVTTILDLFLTISKIKSKESVTHSTNTQIPTKDNTKKSASIRKGRTQSQKEEASRRKKEWWAKRKASEGIIPPTDAVS